eukprot:scaffold202860_cov39-Prasinocladus_malaysianus.AAC.1
MDAGGPGRLPPKEPLPNPEEYTRRHRPVEQTTYKVCSLDLNGKLFKKSITRGQAAFLINTCVASQTPPPDYREFLDII